MTNINTIFEYCHALVILYNLLDCLYLEDRNIYRPVLKKQPQLCFLSKKN